MFKGVVSIAPFIEHPFVDADNPLRNQFDIVLSNKFSMQEYCESMLSTLCNLDKSQVKPFLEYQCKALSKTILWLNKVEKLIDLNDELFVTKKQKLNIVKASDSINLIRERLETKIQAVKNNRYDFEIVKSKLKEYPSFEEQISFLLDAQTEYKQKRPTILNPHAVPFDQKIDLEIEKLNQQEILKEKAANRVDLLAKHQTKHTEKVKLQITCNLNYFVDIHFQLYEQGIIIGTPAQIAEKIVDNYSDKFGNPISIDSVTTMLKPSNTNKRPKGNSRRKL